MSDRRTEVLEIAQRSRAWAERIGRTCFGMQLMGMCAIASAHLFRELTAAGYKARICANDQHCWVEMPFALVLDITATQFGKDRVLIAHRSELDNTAGQWTADYSFCTVQDLRAWQIKSGWRSFQIVAPAS